jgi:hypothetical protein
MKKIIYLFIGLFIIVQGCQTNSKLNDSDKAVLVNAVKDKSNQYWSLLQSYTLNQPYDTGTFRKFMKFWDKNSDRLWQSDPVSVIFNTEITKTEADWEAKFKKMIETRISTNPTILESHFAVLSNDVVLEVNKGDFTITGKDSVVYGPFTMVNTQIWVNRNGDWKMQFFHESTAKKSE